MVNPVVVNNVTDVNKEFLKPYSKDSVLKYDVNLIQCESNITAREKTTSKILIENDLHFIHISTDEVFGSLGENGL